MGTSVFVFVIYYALCTFLCEKRKEGEERERKRERGEIDEEKIVISVMVTRSNLGCNNGRRNKRLQKCEQAQYNM